MVCSELKGTVCQVLTIAVIFGVEILCVLSGSTMWGMDAGLDKAMIVIKQALLGLVGEETFHTRDIPAPPPPGGGGPSSKDFDDSSWEIADLPHDGIIGGTYNQSALDSHAYLPLNITWYRKHFNLPIEWKGNSVRIYFEGVFRASITYLNGQQLLYHDSGYTSFSV